MSAISAPVSVSAEQISQLEDSLQASEDAEADIEPPRSSSLAVPKVEELSPLPTLQPEPSTDDAIAPLESQAQHFTRESALLQPPQPESLQDYATPPVVMQASSSEPAMIPSQSPQPELLEHPLTLPMGRRAKPLAQGWVPLQSHRPEPFYGYAANPLSRQIKSSEPRVGLFPTAQIASANSSRQAIAPELDTSNLVRVIPHALDANQAATLYVSDIPVLTFVGQELEALNTKGYGELPATSSADHDGPAYQAMTIASRLDQFYKSEGNPDTILVRWDATLEEYVIDVADEALVVINEAVMLPDTTNDFGEDALQATNRLRRLLGGAEPLAAVKGQPESAVEAQHEVAVDSNWDVTTIFTGQASWYGPGFHGRRTASGEVFNQEAMTAAHRTLPFGTLVRVTNLSNNDEVVVRINDRGPFSHGRILDLSAAAAHEIGLYHAGVGQIRLEVLSDE